MKNLRTAPAPKHRFSHGASPGVLIGAAAHPARPRHAVGPGQSGHQRYAALSLAMIVENVSRHLLTTKRSADTSSRAVLSHAIARTRASALQRWAWFRILDFGFKGRFVFPLLLALPLSPLAADDPPVTPEQGNVNPTGKFTPRTSQLPGRPPPPESALQTLGDGRLKIGEVVMDAAARTVIFPAWVNMNEGMVEYALVMESGKVHEAIFATRATAEHLHIACLLLGLNAARLGAGTNVPPENAVKVEVAWETNGPERRVPLGDCVALADESGKITGALPGGPWFYAGSQIDTAGFAATREGSLISVISDSLALINNPHAGRENDRLHRANAHVLPRKGVLVRFILTLPPAKTSRTPVAKPADAAK